jgi:hypothetical protein
MLQNEKALPSETVVFQQSPDGIPLFPGAHHVVAPSQIIHHGGILLGQFKTKQV